MIAVLEAAKAGLFRRDQWARNIVAGVIVGVVALPLAMAFAIASGVKPEQGIYTAIVAGIVVALCGGSRIQIAGPTGAFVVILAGVTAQYGIEGLLLATCMAGVILILLGVANFGGVLRFIPDPVIAGFTAGIGVIIWVGQWKDFFGLPAMVVATALQAAFHFDGVATISSAFGEIPRGLPHLILPAVTFDRLVTLVPAAFTIAMLGAIESLLSAAVADGMAGTRHDSNQELIGQGIANVLTPFLGGFAATGAIARTATNYRNGATGPLAGIVHSITLVLILLLLAPVAGRVPLAALAAILFFVAWNMSEARHFVRMVRRAPRPDVAILLITFLLTVFTDLVVAVNVGVILAMLLFLRRMAASVEVLRVEEGELHSRLPHDVRLPADVMIYSIEGPFFFGAVESWERTLKRTNTDPRCIVIHLARVPFMDITGIQALEEATENLERRGVRVLLCEARSNVLAKLMRAGLVGEHAGKPRYFQELSAAVRACSPESLLP
jgi:sulfate permease, SulP family